VHSHLFSAQPQAWWHPRLGQLGPRGGAVSPEHGGGSASQTFPRRPRHRPVPESFAGKQTWPTRETRRTLRTTWATTCRSCLVTARGRTLATGGGRDLEPAGARRGRGSGSGAGRTERRRYVGREHSPNPGSSPRRRVALCCGRQCWGGQRCSLRRAGTPVVSILPNVLSLAPRKCRGPGRRRGPSRVSSRYFSWTSMYPFIE
jgi:hypothetical protein